MKFSAAGIDKDKCTVLEQLYTQYRKLMYFIAYDILRDHFLAEDAVQTAFFKLAKSKFSLDSVSCNKTKSFMVIVTRNIAISAYNTKKKQGSFYEEDELMEVPDEKTLPLDFIVDNENVALLQKTLAGMDAKYADIVFMRYFSGYSVAEISALFEISEQLVRVRLHRARKMLMTRLSGEENEQE